MGVEGSNEKLIVLAAQNRKKRVLKEASHQPKTSSRQRDHDRRNIGEKTKKKVCI